MGNQTFSPEVKQFLNDLRHLSKKWYTLSMTNGGRESMFLDGYNAGLLAARDDLEIIIESYDEKDFNDQ